MEEGFSTGKMIWERACKQTLEDISKVFADEENLSKFSDQMDRVKFRALGKKIQDFPIPEYPFPLPAQPGIYGLAELLSDTATRATIIGTNGYELASKFNDILMNHLFYKKRMVRFAACNDGGNPPFKGLTKRKTRILFRVSYARNPSN